MAQQAGFRALLMDALKHFSDVGYTNEADLQDWLLRLAAALERELPADKATRAELAAALGAIFKRDVERGGVQKRVQAVSRYTLDRIEPSLRAELDRRIFAGVDLIRLNKKAATEKTLQRFLGWITSVPKGGTPTTNLRDVASQILKPTAQLKFERRRVAIDQGHKLSSAVAQVVAIQHGAIAAVWHDRGEFDHGYDARPEHLRRTGKLFLVRDSWAMTEGLVKKRGVQYTDEIEQPAELPFCSCYYTYVTSPRELPAELLTAKGRAWIDGRGWVANVRPPTRFDAIVRADPDAAARDIAPNPTPAQRAAGNYRKGHVQIAGLDIAIETPKNALRAGVGVDGKLWTVSMPAHYGYLKRTVGADDEEVDCYVGPDADANSVWVIDQLDTETKSFDEQKVMIGFGSRAEALTAYCLGFSDGRGLERVGGMREMTVEEFRRRLTPSSAAL